MAFKLQFRFGIYAPGHGPADFELFDEIWIKEQPWDGHTRGAIVIDVDFAPNGDRGMVRAMNRAGVIFGASRYTHRVIRHWTDPEPEPLCMCGHKKLSHWCWGQDVCPDTSAHWETGKFVRDVPEHDGQCNYLNCRCLDWNPIEESFDADFPLDAP